MLDEKYGRLIVIAAFSAVLVGLLAIPGINKPKVVKNNQLNTDVKISRENEPIVVTQEQKEEFNKKIEKEISTLSKRIEQESLNQTANQEVMTTREEQILNDWGMNDTSEHKVITKTEPVQPNRPVFEVSKPQEEPVQQQKTERIPNSKILKVNGKCFSAIALPKTMSKEECDSTARIYSVKTCSEQVGRDAWAGAVTACRGPKNMPTIEDLFAIARLIYDNDFISLTSSHYSKYPTLENFSKEDPSCDKFYFDRVTYKSDIAAEYGLPETPGYALWAGREISPLYAQALTYNEKTVNYNSCYSRSDTSTYAMCVVQCK